jgi:hypothetical protein
MNIGTAAQTAAVLFLLYAAHAQGFMQNAAVN